MIQSYIPLGGGGGCDENEVFFRSNFFSDNTRVRISPPPPPPPPPHPQNLTLG